MHHGAWTGLDTLADAAPWPMPIRLDLTGNPREDRAGVAAPRLPASPGVLAVVHRASTPSEVVAVSATGNLRAHAAARLSPGGWNTDLGPLADGVLACPTGSGFEADWAQAVLAQRWTPEAHHNASDRGRPWFLVLDPDADQPVWRSRDTLGSRADPSTVLGPFPGKSAAEECGRALDDRFELCREPGLLSQRPNATACAYKDMGRCPAACDGSEPIEAYRQRARSAVAFLRTPVAVRRQRITSRIAEASAALDFERAAALRAELEALDLFPERTTRWATTLDRFGVLAVLTSGRKGWARLVVCRGGSIGHAADVAPRDAEAVIASCLDGWISMSTPGPVTVSGEAGPTLGVLCGRLFSRRKTRSSLLRLDPPPSGADVLRAVERAAGVAVDADDRAEGDRDMPEPEPGTGSEMGDAE